MRVRSAVVIGLAAACGCAPDLPELQWFGRYVAFGTDAPVRPCGATIPRMDRFVERTNELFDRTPLEEPISVYYLPEAWEHGYPCPEPEGHGLISGCADPSARTAFFEGLFALEHELVHVVMVDMVGYHDPLFDEGTAEALGSWSPPARFSSPDDDRVEDMVGWPVEPGSPAWFQIRSWSFERSNLSILGQAHVLGSAPALPSLRTDQVEGAIALAWRPRRSRVSPFVAFRTTSSAIQGEDRPEVRAGVGAMAGLRIALPSLVDLLRRWRAR
jgi:hypothetical protein